MTPAEFIRKWHRFQGKESAAYQEHFNDLCRLLGQPTPAEADPSGNDFFCFQKRVVKDAELFELHDTGEEAAARGARLCRRVEEGLLRLGIQGQEEEPRRGLQATAPLPRVAAESAPAGGLRFRPLHHPHQLQRHGPGNARVHQRPD